MILCVENPKIPHTHTLKLLEIMNGFSNVSGYKVNIQNLDALLYTNNEWCDEEIMKTILFTIVLKRIKYLGCNLPKEV